MIKHTASDIQSYWSNRTQWHVKKAKV